MVNKPIYLTCATLITLTSIYLLYKFILSSMMVKGIVLSGIAVCILVPQIGRRLSNLLNEMYNKCIYENSTFWVIFYDLTCTLFPSKEINQINYGYAPLNQNGHLIEIPSEYEKERMSLQLYYRTVTCLQNRENLDGLTVLEVSSGRGGGLEFLTKNYRIKKAIGLDLSANNVEWCKTTYAHNKILEFVVGDAESFVDDGAIQAGSVDVVISVDSAHLYPHFDRFVHQCGKALKKGGFLCISDFMAVERFPVREEILENETTMKIVKKEQTTKNILHAMDIDGERRKQLVDQHTIRFLKFYFKWQTGAKGSRIYNLLSSGQFVGAGWLLEKV